MTTATLRIPASLQHPVKAPRDRVPPPLSQELPLAFSQGLTYDPRRVPVHVFFNPELVEQLAACGISARSRRSPPRGFVLGGRTTRDGGPRRAETHVVDVRGLVTITGPRRLPRSPPTPPPLVEASEPRTALALADECARLRRDNQRLAGEVTSLREEIASLTRSAKHAPLPPTAEDDTVLRFALLELE